MIPFPSIRFQHGISGRYSDAIAAPGFDGSLPGLDAAKIPPRNARKLSGLDVSDFYRGSLFPGGTWGGTCK